MRASTKLLALLLLLTVSLSYASISFSQTQPALDVQSEIHEAYKALVEVYNAGGNITALTWKINEALNLASQAKAVIGTNPNEAARLESEARALADSVVLEAPAKKDEGLRQGQMMTIVIVASVTALIAGGIFIYTSGPKVLWKMWLRLRKNYRVKIKDSSTESRGLIVTSEEVCAAILGIIIIIAFLATFQTFLPRTAAEPFSELGVLGPNLKLGDYPREIVAGENVYLNAYVGNQMGRPTYYVVMVKLGDNGTIVDPVQVEPIQQFESVLPSNGTWTFPVNVRLTQVGLNQRIIFELWLFNETSNQNQYHERWTHTWINVTAPAT